MSFVDIARGEKRRLAPALLLVIVALAGVLAPGTWPFTAITAVCYALFALSVGLLFGQLNLLSLCPLTFAAAGVWFISWLNQHTGLPLVLSWPLAALCAAPLGLVIAGLALRLRGVYLAIVTLSFAALGAAVLDQHPFPGETSQKVLARPVGFTSDRGYFVFCLIVLIAVGGALAWYGRRKGGHAWLAVRHSERATAAAGISVPRVKLEAFLVSAVIAGLGGVLIAAQTQGAAAPSSFGPSQSLLVVAVAVMAGAYGLSGAIVAGILAAVVPQIFTRLSIDPNFASIIFGLGALQALTKGGGGIAAGFPWLTPRRSSQAAPSAPPALAVSPRAEPRAGEDPVLVVTGITVRYGAVTALANVDIVVPPRTVVGVIGPNGAGKSTLIDTLCGFVPGYVGSIELGGREIDRLGPAARARAGLRRTFQQGRAVPELTVGDYVGLWAPEKLEPARLEELLGFLGLPPADEPISLVDVGTRRVVEIAACLAAQPIVAFLDEPAAGLSSEQSEILGHRIAEIPDRFGCSVLLVEHDVEMVADVCSAITVLDFGVVLDAGPPGEVLANPEVRSAYLGADVSPEHERAAQAAAAEAAKLPIAGATP